MTRYVRLDDRNVVREIIVPPEGVPIERMFHAQLLESLRACDDASVQEYWTYDPVTGTFAPPAVASPRYFMARDLLEMLTPADVARINAAVLAEAQAPDQAQGVGLLWTRLQGQGEKGIDLEGPTFQHGRLALVSVLGAERATALIAAITARARP